MKERPIIFSGPMVSAILDGRKTQTRRAIKVPVDTGEFVVVEEDSGWWPYKSDDGETNNLDGMEVRINCPYGKPGDRLWVRETSRAAEDKGGTDGVIYAADNAFMKIENTQEAADAWIKMYHYRGVRGSTVPPIHMPRWASRIDLEITGIRVERLQDISEADAAAEGVTREDSDVGRIYWHDSRSDWSKDPRHAYEQLWQSINGPQSWEANPWVWVIEFKRLAA